jgi:hypothetical protein
VDVRACAHAPIRGQYGKPAGPLFCYRHERNGMTKIIVSNHARSRWLRRARYYFDNQKPLEAQIIESVQNGKELSKKKKRELKYTTTTLENDIFVLNKHQSMIYLLRKDVDTLVIVTCWRILL